MDAHKRNDKLIRIKYDVGIKKAVGAGVSRKLIRPESLVRKATIYWTRNPLMVNSFQKRVWPMIILENKEPYLPTSEEDAREKFFDGEVNFQILGADIGRGSHTLRAHVRASWGRHIFSEKGSANGVSGPIKIRCE